VESLSGVIHGSASRSWNCMPLHMTLAPSLEEETEAIFVQSQLPILISCALQMRLSSWPSGRIR